METPENFISRKSESFNRQQLIVKVLLVIIFISILCCICTVPVYILTRDRVNQESTFLTDLLNEETATHVAPTSTATPASTSTPASSATPASTATPITIPSDTPVPTTTALPPAAITETYEIPSGTYLVGSDIQPGLYRGYAGSDLFRSCYWERLSDTSGELGSIIANDNSIGQFYIKVAETDFALTTHCDLTRLETLPAPPATYPTTILPGTYLVNADILPGMYQGQGGTDFLDSCYWERLYDVSGDFRTIIANDNSTGQFYIQVYASDFALHTACELTRIGD